MYDTAADRLCLAERVANVKLADLFFKTILIIWSLNAETLVYHDKKLRLLHFVWKYSIENVQDKLNICLLSKPNWK